MNRSQFCNSASIPHPYAAIIVDGAARMVVVCNPSSASIPLHAVRTAILHRHSFRMPLNKFPPFFHFLPAAVPLVLLFRNGPLAGSPHRVGSFLATAPSYAHCPFSERTRKSSKMAQHPGKVASQNFHSRKVCVSHAQHPAAHRCHHQQ